MGLRLKRGKNNGTVRNSDLKEYSKLAKDALRTQLNRSNDNGLQSASTMISSAEKVIKTGIGIYKVEQNLQAKTKINKVIGKKVDNFAKNTLDSAKRNINLVRGLKNGKITLKQAVKTTLVNTALVRNSLKVVDTAKTTVKIVKGIKSGKIKISQILKNKIVNTALVRNTIQIGVNIKNATQSTIKIIRGIKSGKIKVGKIIATKLINQAKTVGDIIRNKSIEQVMKVKNNVTKVANTVKTGIDKTIYGIKIVKGVLTGRVKISPAQAKILMKNALKNTSKVAVIGAKTTLKTAQVVSKVGLKTTVSIGKVGGVVGSGLMKMDDSGLQSAGLMLKTTQYAPKAMKTAVKLGLKTGKVGIKTAKTTVRGVKGTVKGVKFIRKNGFKATGKAIGNATLKGTKKLAQKSAEALLQASKGLIIKVVIPAVAFILCAATLVSAASAPIVAVGSMLDGFLAIFRKNDKGQMVEEIVDVDVELTNRIANNRTQLVLNTVNTSITQIGTYHFVRYENNAMHRLDYEHNVRIALTPTINDDILSSSEYLNMIQPFFSTIMMMNYPKPTIENVETEVTWLWGYFDNIIVTPLPSTYCGTVHSCGSIHANSDCPNIIIGTHTSYICDSCCVNKAKMIDNPEYPLAVAEQELKLEEYYLRIDEYNYWLEIEKADSSNMNIPGDAREQYYNNIVVPMLNYYINTFGYDWYTRTSDIIWNEASGVYDEYIIAWEIMCNTPMQIQDGIEFDKCNGYQYCIEHKNCQISIEDADFDTLMKAVYDDPIAILEANTARTLEEQRKLDDLKDWRDIAIELKKSFDEERGT